jgi:hypothetical protein
LQLTIPIHGGLWLVHHPHSGRDITWHDGESSGFASAIALDPQRKSAVVILSDTGWPVIGPAVRLLLTQSSETEAHRELD